MPLTALDPPASEKTCTAVVPSGATSRTSTSSGTSCAKPLSVRLRSATLPVKPLTSTVDGYGSAAPWLSAAPLEGTWRKSLDEYVLARDIAGARRNNRAAAARLVQSRAPRRGWTDKATPLLWVHGWSSRDPTPDDEQKARAPDRRCRSPGSGTPPDEPAADPQHSGRMLTPRVIEIGRHGHLLTPPPPPPASKR